MKKKEEEEERRRRRAEDEERCEHGMRRGREGGRGGRGEAVQVDFKRVVSLKGDKKKKKNSMKCNWSLISQHEMTVKALHVLFPPAEMRPNNISYINSCLYNFPITACLNHLCVNYTQVQPHKVLFLLAFCSLKIIKWWNRLFVSALNVNLVYL